ncbi:MAG: SH3 domain-containing protein [Hyphomicrobiaceae bacterium]|nr:SH3 domain-containing protein [Hyphomicrobiaceae bacterium]
MHFSRTLKLGLASAMTLITAGNALALDAMATTELNVRTGGGTNFAVVDQLYAGEIVNVVECQTNGWCYVDHDGPDGWVSKNFLTQPPSQGQQTGNQPSSNDDAAKAAALAAILGFGAAVVGGAIIHNQQQNNLPYGPDTCKQGYVWREAHPQDHVCVTPQSRTLVAQENANAGLYVDPNGAYGPNSCKQGFVWREAYQGDVVCVTPQRRADVHQENLDADSHKVQP